MVSGDSGHIILADMPVIVCLLRGVNVGGHHKIGMDALRKLCERLGLRGVRTCGQSGNIVFRCPVRNSARLGTQIEDAIEAECGFRAAVLLRTRADLRGAILRNPFSNRAGIDPSRLIVMFLPAEPAPETREELLAIQAAPEELRIAGREIFIHFPTGMGRSPLPPLLEKKLERCGTARNWNTVTKLLEMAEALERPHCGRSQALP